jgi:hypothetical protein
MALTIMIITQTITIQINNLFMVNLRHILALLLVFSATSMVIPHLGKLKGHVPRVYKVQVDDPPEVRWAPMVHDYRHAINHMLD